MKNNNYSATIEVPNTPQDVYNKINNVSNWWGKDFEGNSTKLNDEFIMRFGVHHYSKQKLVEVVPNKKVVWLVTDSKLDWIANDKYEWTGTKMIFELTPKGGKTELRFTHEGLLPDKECYNQCVKGWDMLIKERLPNA